MRLLAVGILFVLPALLLFESLFLGNDFIPFDLRVFPPASASLDAQTYKSLRERGNWEITEKTALVVPEYQLAKQELKAGRLPHYNPWVRAGAPLFANILDGFAYPLHLPLFFGRTEARFGIVAFMAFVLAGLFMLGFLREIELTWPAALFGAIVFQLSGTLAANAHFFMRMETLAWLPAGFWALERYARRRQITAALAFSLCLAMTWLAGFPPYALVCSLAFGARILTIVAAQFLAQRRTRHRAQRQALAATMQPTASAGPAWKGLLLLGAACGLGIGLAAVQLVPMLDYFPEAQRNLSQSLDELVNQGLDPLALLGLAAPFPFGSPIGFSEFPYEKNPIIHELWTRRSPTTGKLFWPTNYNFTEYAIFLGVFPLVCAVASLFGGARFRRFAWLAFVMAFVLATGGAVFQFLAQLPVLKSTPPSRFIGLSCFFGAALAGIGFEAITQRFGPRRRRTTALLAAVLAALALSIALWAKGLADDPSRAIAHVVRRLGSHWSTSFPEVAGDPNKIKSWFGPYAVQSYQCFANALLSFALILGASAAWIIALPFAQDRHRARLRRGMLAFAIAATACSLLLRARHVAPSFAPPAASSKATANPVLAFLRKQRSASREAGGFSVARVAKQAGLPIPLPPNQLIPEHIRDLNAYAFVDARSHLPFLELYGPPQMIRQYWLKSLPVDKRLDLGLFDLSGVRYLISASAFPSLGEPVIPPFEGMGATTYVYERKSALARAFLVPRAKIAANDKSMIAHMITKDFDPRKTVWLHDVPESALADRPVADAGAIARARLRFVRDEATQLEVEVQDSPGAWLVLSDAVYKHWNASIDGQPTNWYRANLFTRAVWMPKGSHNLSFEYDARPFWIGLIISAASLLIVLIVWLGSYLSAWRHGPRRRRGIPGAVS